MLVFTQEQKKQTAESIHQSIRPTSCHVVTWSLEVSSSTPLKGLGLGSTGCLVSCCGADEDHRPSVTQDRIRDP